MNPAVNADVLSLSRPRQRVGEIESDLNYLVLRYLSGKVDGSTYQSLYKALKSRTESSRVTSFPGSYRHIPDDYLLLICKRALQLADLQVPNGVAKVQSLLGTGRFSLLRNSKDVSFVDWCEEKLVASYSDGPFVPPVNYTRPVNITSVIRARTLTSHALPRHIQSANVVFTKMKHLTRVLGHLMHVYCCSFDRTGTRIFTGADDGLVKCWDATTGRLLCSFRGFEAEVADVLTNQENTLLAAGGNDSSVRVWDLHTTAPVAVLKGHGGLLSSIEFSPWVDGEKRFLASTALDGTLCIWPHIGKNFDFPPIVFSEKDKPSSQTLCLSFSPGGALLVTGNSEHLLRIYHFSPTGAVSRIAEINGHADKIDSIEFSHSGDKFISGSRDGTAKIWRLQKSVGTPSVHWTFENITLNVNEHVVEQRSDSTPRSHQLNGSVSERNNSKLRVLMVAWDLEDKRVFTSASDFTVRIWDPITGEHLAALKGHQDEAYVIQPHPTNPRILLSGSHDGYLIVWDCFTCQPIKKFFNQMEGQGFSSVFDCKWSPDGLGIAATDAYGQLLIVGHGSLEPFKDIEYEQFFHTDYRPLLWDERGTVLDEQTRIAPHLMVPPFLVNADGAPYPPEKQKFVPGRENLSAALQVAVTNRAEEGPLRVISGVSALDAMIERLANQQRQNGILSPENAAPSTNTSTQSAAASASTPRLNVSPISNVQMGTGFSPTVASQLNQIKSSHAVWSHRQLAMPLNSQAAVANIKMRKRLYLNDVSLWHPGTIRRQFRREVRIRENREAARMKEALERQAPFAQVIIPPSQTQVTSSSQSRRRGGGGSSSQPVAPLASSQETTGPSASNNSQHGEVETASTSGVNKKSSRQQPLNASFLLNEESNTNAPESLSGMSLEETEGSVLTSSQSLSKTLKDIICEKDKEADETLQPKKFVIEDSNQAPPLSDDEYGRDNLTSDDSSSEDDQVLELLDPNACLHQSSDSSVSYEGMYGSDDPDFDMNRLRGSNLDEIMPVSYSSVARKKVLKDMSRKIRSATSGGESSPRKRKMPKLKHDVMMKRKKRNRGIKRRPRSLSDSEKRRKRIKFREVSARRPNMNTNSKLKRHQLDSESDGSGLHLDLGDRRKVAQSSSHLASPAERGARRNAAKQAQLQVLEHTPFYCNWVTDTAIHRTPYVPQLGDLVYFFPGGHDIYRKRVERIELYLLQEFCPEVELPHCLKDTPRILGQIVDVKYQSVPTYPTKSLVSGLPGGDVGSHISLCTVTLVASIDDSSSSPTVQTIPGCSPILITWHDLEHIEDCIVLHHFVREAINQNWTVGDRFKIPLEGKWFYGEIIELEPDKGGLSCATVKYDNGDDDLVSLWDMKRLTEEDLAIIYKTGVGKRFGAKVSQIDMRPEDEAQFQYQPMSGEWGNSTREKELTRIKSCLLQLADEQIAEQFGAPVDLSLFPTYIDQVGYPTDLLTIKQRLENGFYRRLMALTWEIDLIAHNAEKFNYPTAPIVANARVVTAILKYVVRDQSCTDVKPVVARMRETLSMNPKIDLSSHMRCSKFDPSWKSQCASLMYQLINLPESVNIRESVMGESSSASSELGAPGADASRRPANSLNLYLIQSKLNQEVYEDPLQFANDIRTLINESKQCNASKKSRTKAMAIRLSGIFEENFQAIFEDYKHARRFHENMNYGGRSRNVFLCQSRSMRKKRLDLQTQLPENTSSAHESDSEIDASTGHSKLHKEPLTTIEEEKKCNNEMFVDNTARFPDETDDNDAVSSSCSEEQEESGFVVSRAAGELPVYSETSNLSKEVENFVSEISESENPVLTSTFASEQSNDAVGASQTDLDNTLNAEVANSEPNMVEYVKKPVIVSDEREKSPSADRSKDDDERSSYTFRGRRSLMSLKEISSSPESESDEYVYQEPVRSVRAKKEPGLEPRAARVKLQTLPQPPPLERSPQKKRLAKNRPKRSEPVRSEASSVKSQRSSARIATTRSLNLAYMLYYEDSDEFTD